MKTLKRQLDEESFSESKEKYDRIVSNTEFRDDVDFFRTIKHLCKKYNISWILRKAKYNKSETAATLEENEIRARDEIIGYLTEIGPLAQQLKIIFEFIWYGILFLAPIAIFILCVIAKLKNVTL